MDIEIKKLSPGDTNDFLELIRVFHTAFEMQDFKMPDPMHLQSLLNDPGFLTLVSKDHKKVTGGLTVYILNGYYSTRPVAYVYDIGVLPGYQRNGIGKKLITFLTEYCKENGFEEAFVDSEIGDLQAVNFYRSTAFSNEVQVAQFTYSLFK